MTTRYTSFIALNTHPRSTENTLYYESLDLSDPELKVMFASESAHRPSSLQPPRVWIAQGRENVIMPPSTCSSGRTGFVRELLHTMQLKDTDSGRELIERAQDLEATKRYRLPADHCMPIRVGRLSEVEAAALVRPKFTFEFNDAGDRQVTHKPQGKPPKGFAEWHANTAAPVELAHREARQILLRVELAGPAVLRLHEIAIVGNAKQPIGSFLVPFLDV
ncbi:MAG: hypothetical protein ABW352_05750 [Polyangiales bacterium]